MTCLKCRVARCLPIDYKQIEESLLELSGISELGEVSECAMEAANGLSGLDFWAFELEHVPGCSNAG